MKKSRVYIIIAVIITALIVVKAKFFTPVKKKGAALVNSGKKPALPVTVFVIGNEKIQTKVYSNGTILANEETELKSEVSGRIIYMHLPEGKAVNAGTLLLKVNDAEQQKQLEKINVQLKLASDVEYRQRKLLEINAISKQDYEIALSNMLSLKADSAQLRAQIDKTEIRAPFNGIIGIRSVSPGSYITSASAVAFIHQINPVKIEFTLPEKYTSLFREGDQITFKTEGSGIIYTGKIIVKDPAVDLASRSVRYRALTNNPQGVLLPGAFVAVELVVQENRNAVFVPTEAIVPVAKGKKVFIVKDGIAKERLVTTGVRTEDYVQIVSGLQQGDSVVINGNFQLKDNSSVKAGKSKTDKQI